jgi:hypothetical protein
MKRPSTLSITVTAFLLLLFGSLSAWSAWLCTLPDSGTLVYVGELGRVEDFWGYWGTGATINRRGYLWLFHHSLFYPGNKPAAPGTIVYYPRVGNLGPGGRTNWPKAAEGRWFVLPLLPVVVALAIVSGLLALRLYLLIRRRNDAKRGFVVIADIVASHTDREWAEATKRIRRPSGI